MTSLTAHLHALQTSASYREATEHPFLCLAGAGDELPQECLALFLSQDRIYAREGYPRFIGALLAQFPLTASPIASSGDRGQLSSQLQDRILKLLVFSLQGVVREVEFFGETAATWGLDLDCWMEREGTRDYTAEMKRIVAPGPDSGFEEGLVFLWAMERVYLDAWTFVKSRSPKGAVAALANNWSDSDFVAFVDDLAKIVDDLPGFKDSHGVQKAEKVWQRVLELEAGFWPTEGEEKTFKLD